MADQIYKVQDPSGNMREISGPAGASDAEIIAQAQQLFASKPIAPQPEQSTMQRIVTGALSKTPFSPLNVLMAGAQTAGGMGDKALNSMGYDLGGKITDTASGLGASPEVSAGLGTAGNVGLQAGGAYLTGKLAGALASPAMEEAGKVLMRSALNAPIKARMSGKAEQAVQTMLDKGYNPTVGGADAMSQAASGLGKQVTAITDKSPYVIQKTGVYDPVHQALTRALTQVNPNTDANAVRKAWTEFDEAFPGETMPVKLAQALKQGTYQSLGDKAYGVPMSSDMASQGAQKAITRGINEQIGKVEPATAPLLADQSALLNAAKLAKARGMTQQGTTMLGIAPAASSPARFAAFLLDKYGLSKSLLARALYSGSERLPEATAGISTALASAIRAQQEQQP